MTGAAAAAPASVLALRVVGADGTVTALRDVVGDAPAVVAFWATYCPPCRAEVPALNRALDAWRARGVRILAVALDDDPTKIRDAHDTWAMRYDTLRVAPGEDAVTDALFPHGLPTTAFIAHGEATLHDKLVDDETLARLIPPLLETPTKTTKP